MGKTQISQFLKRPWLKYLFFNDRPTGCNIKNGPPKHSKLLCSGGPFFMLHPVVPLLANFFYYSGALLKISIHGCHYIICQKTCGCHWYCLSNKTQKYCGCQNIHLKISRVPGTLGTRSNKAPATVLASRSVCLSNKTLT